MSVRTLIIAFALPVISCTAALAQSGELLKGTIQQENFLNSGGGSGSGAPGLTRRDMSGMNTTSDPFDNGAGNQGEAAVNLPASATQTALFAPPTPPANYPGKRESGIPQNFGMESPTGSSYPSGPTNLEASVSANNDPDSSPELQLAWDAWHKRVAAAIFQRFDFFAHSAFRYSPPLMARVGYTVMRDGHIQNLNVVQHSSNPMFDLLITQCVKSLDGNTALLQFPTGSRRNSVDKFGTFTQNYGVEGFKYTTGDRETIRGH